jgi:hypothetical protein
MSFILSAGVITPPLTAGGVAYGNGAQAFMTGAGTTGQALLSNGAGVPAFGAVGVPGGGTGGTTFTLNNVLLGNGTSTFQTVAPGTSGNLLTSNGTTWESTTPSAAGGGIFLGTPVAVSGQTSVDYTGLLSTIKTIQINFYRVNFSSSNSLGVRLGTTGGLETTGYAGITMKVMDGSPYNTVTYADTSFAISTATAGASLTGTMFINLVDGTNFRWVADAVTGSPGAQNVIWTMASSKTLTGALTQLSIFPTGGSTFGSGTINISYGT